jgi:exoribonuclease R
MSPSSKRHSHDSREPLPAPEVTPEQVIAHFATLTQPASIRQIAHGMDLKHRGRRYLPRVIQQLKRRGDIEEIHGGRFRLAGSKHAQSPGPARAAAAEARKKTEPAQSAAPKQGRDPNLVSGRLVAHRDGYGFVVPDAPMPRVDGDLFIGRDNLGDAMHGDHVLARIERRRADKSSSASTQLSSGSSATARTATSSCLMTRAFRTRSPFRRARN